ncbi:hypothetical protein EIK77_001601 [Talaromyces pinophilus]|nr:hypothetical protein EIK77_001601 [Talaromyces pinophilus]
MDGGDVEKSQIESLKQTVRYTSRQRDKARPQQQRSQNQAIPSSSSQTDSVHAMPNGNVDATSSDSQKEESPPSEPSFPLLQTNVTLHDQTNPMLFMGDLSLSDTRLLMHFVDHVYPLQLPISQISVIRNDRNWLLPIIMHIRPFYHSVLGLTALHQGLLTSQSTDEAKRLRVLKYAQKHHSLCLQDLQAAIQLLRPCTPKGSECPRGGVGVCIDETHNWQVHLNAAVSMVEGVEGVRRRTPITEPDTFSTLNYGWDNFVDELYPEHPLLQQQSSMNALIAIAIYLDVISCVTMGKPPRLLEIVHSPACAELPPENTEIRNMFGQEYWVVLLIGEIAALPTPIPVQVPFDGSIANGCNIASHTQIRHSLHAWVQENGPSVEQLQCLDEYTLSASTSIRVTTYLYTLAGIIYLHLTTNGVEASSEEVRSCVSSFMRAFSLTRYTSTPQNLMWAIYVTGSVAVGDERDFFRTILSTSASYFSIGPCSRILKKLEDIWEKSVARIPLFSSDLVCPNLLLV